MTTVLSPTQRLVRLRPGVFSPTIVRGIEDPDGGLSTFSTENGTFLSQAPVGETGSFRYDPIGSGIKSTQQLNVDWSLFENHVFFNSAQVKTNVAFDKIINEYPFDGSQKEIENYFDNLTGFEKWIYNSYPKYKGSHRYLEHISCYSRQAAKPTMPLLPQKKPQSNFPYLFPD